MTNAERVQNILMGASELPLEQRGAYLDAACRSDAALRAEVDSLLKSHDEAGRFLVDPTADSARDLARNFAGDSAPTIVSRAGSETLLTNLREKPGTKIGPYKLLQLIGEGGFGSVFMAEQEKPVARKVALKIIKLGMDTHQVVARFEQERQALAMMDHPNIAKVFDAGSTETGRPYFVMELVKGDPIAEYADKNNLSIPERLELFAQVCSAVQHAHTKGIIHRDIKPSNILVSTQDGRPYTKVIDFGIAKATASKLTEKTLFTEHKALIGTPEYMSPEQAEGNLDIDTRTDVYSLGVLLYELLTGTTPFTGKELRSAAYGEIQRIIREVEPPKPSTRLSSSADTLASVAAKRHTEPKRLGVIVRGELDWIVMKALEKDRQRRYETASGLAMDVRRYLSGEAVLAAPVSGAYRLKKFVHRNRGAVTAGMAIASVLFIGVVAFAWQAKVARDQRDIAVAARQAEAEQRMTAEAQRAKATESTIAEAVAKVAAQTNEQKAIAMTVTAEAARQEEAKARRRAETISTFVTTALRAADAQNGGVAGNAKGAVAAGQNMTILAAMDNAVKDINSGRFKDDPETEAGLRSTIGIILRNNGRLADGEALAVQALEIHRRLHPGDHQAVASSLSDLATMRRELGRTAEAELLMAEALGMYQRLYQGDHPAVAKAMDNYGRARQASGHLAEAREQLQKSLEMRKRLYTGDNADLATGMNNLALVEQDIGQLDKAEPLYQGALDMWRRLYTGDHPDIATGLNNIAYVRLGLGRAAEAEPLLVEALEMWRRLYKGDHEDVAGGLNALASVRRTLGRAAEAEPLQVEALEMYRRLYKGDHPEVATSLSNLASARQSLGRDAEAEAMYAQALEMYRRLYKNDHPSLANAFGNLARAQQTLGKTNEARRGLDEAAAMHRRLTPSGSPRLARALWRSGSAHLEGNAAAAALPELEEAVAMAEKFLPPQHANVKDYRQTLAKCKAALSEQSKP